MPSNLKTSEECHQRRGFLLAKKIGSIISIACGSRRTPQQLCSDDAKECTAQLEKAAILEDNEGAFNRFPSIGRSTSYRKQSQKHVKRPVIVSSSSSSSSPYGLFRKSAGFHLRRWRTVKTTREFSERQGSNKWTDDSAREGVVELCKKRILMGERCRPLNISGVLHYDEDGILLPEDVLTSDNA